MAKKRSVKTPHVPMRTCIGTGVKKPKMDMIRLALDITGNVIVDTTGKHRSRGANIDSSLDAFDMAIKKNSITKALKLDKPLSSEKVEILRAEFESAIESKTFRKGNKSVTIRVKSTDIKNTPNS